MSKSVLIVEKDRDLISALSDALQQKGFEVADSTDGKGAPELIRSTQPQAVVLAVDLDAGQNGYIICKKLKSDDDLKGVPVIIIGDPKGFAQHQKLKTRADEYVGKPLNHDALVDTVGRLIGFPEAAGGGDDAFDPGSLLEEDALDEVAIEEPVEEGNAEADLAMVDSMFDESSGSAGEAEEEISLSSIDEAELGDDGPPERTVVGFMPTDPAARPYVPTTSGIAGLDSGEARELRSRVTELTSALDDAKSKQDELESRVRELETELESKSTELEATRASSGKSDNKEVFALREAGTKKDKEILRLKNELNAKEQELIELQEKQNSLEQAQSNTEEETALKDAQLKTLQSKADGLTAEKKKADQALSSAKEEARAAQAQLSTLQADFDQLQARVPELEGELDALRNSQQEVESARTQLEGELSEVRGELDTARAELDSTRDQVTQQATSFADEISGLRQRLADAEAQAQTAEDRASRQQSRVRAQADQLDRLKSSLQSALDGLNDAPGDSEEIELDELAEA